MATIHICDVMGVVLTGGDSSNLKPLLLVFVSTLTGWGITTCAACRGRWVLSPITYNVSGLLRDTNWGAVAGYLQVVGRQVCALIGVSQAIYSSHYITYLD